MTSRLPASSPTSLASLPECRGGRSCVIGLGGAARKDNLAGIVGEVAGPLGEEYLRAERPLGEQHEDRCLSQETCSGPYPERLRHGVSATSARTHSGFRCGLPRKCVPRRSGFRDAASTGCHSI